MKKFNYSFKSKDGKDWKFLYPSSPWKIYIFEAKSAASIFLNSLDHIETMNTFEIPYDVQEFILRLFELEIFS